MRQPKIDRNATERLERELDASVRKALDKIAAAVRESLDEGKTNRSNSTSE